MSSEHEHEQVHIHFHRLIEPFAERLVKVETLTGLLDNDIKELKSDLKENTTLLANHAEEENRILSDMASTISNNNSEIRSLKSWIIGIGTGLGIVAALITALSQMGVFG